MLLFTYTGGQYIDANARNSAPITADYLAGGFFAIRQTPVYHINDAYNDGATAAAAAV